MYTLEQIMPRFLSAAGPTDCHLQFPCPIPAVAGEAFESSIL